MAGSRTRKAATSLVVASLEDFGITDLREVGRGATSTVYSGVQEQYDREVAIKVFATPLHDDKARRRFDRECKTLGRLSKHPNVVNLFGSAFDADGRPFIVMDLCQGGSLHDLLAQRGPMEVSDILRIGVKIAAALDFAHRNGVLHRDIKPGNVLLTSFGEPVLSDFGISGGIETGLSWTVGESLTPLFAAPEVLETGGGTVESDIWSLAGTLWALLVGHAPFADTASGLLTLVNRIINDPLPALCRDDVPEALEALLSVGMSKTPADRPADAASFARALQEVQREAGLVVTEYVDLAQAIKVPAQPTGNDISGRRPTTPPKDALPQPPTSATVLRRGARVPHEELQQGRPRRRPSLPHLRRSQSSVPEVQPPGPPDLQAAVDHAGTDGDLDAAGDGTVLRRAVRQERPKPAIAPSQTGPRRRWAILAGGLTTALIAGVVVAVTSHSSTPLKKSAPPISTQPTTPTASLITPHIKRLGCKGHDCQFIVSGANLAANRALRISFGSGQGRLVRAGHPFAQRLPFNTASVTAHITGSGIRPDTEPIHVGLTRFSRHVHLAAAGSHHLRFFVASHARQCRGGHYQVRERPNKKWLPLKGRTGQTTGRTIRFKVGPGKYDVLMLRHPVVGGLCMRAVSHPLTVKQPHPAGSSSGSNPTTSLGGTTGGTSSGGTSSGGTGGGGSNGGGGKDKGLPAR